MSKCARLTSVLLVALVSVGWAQEVPSTLQRAFDLIEQKAYAQAIPLLEQVLAQDSLLLPVYVALGSAYLEAHNPLAAERIVLQGLRHFPEAYVLKWIYAESLFYQQELSRAFSTYRMLEGAVKREEELGIAHPRQLLRLRMGQILHMLGEQAFSQQDTLEAIHKLKQALRYMPDSLQVVQNLAYLYLKTHQPAEALHLIASYEEGRRLPDPLLQLKASALYQLKQYEALAAHYQHLYQQRRDVESGLLYGQALLLNHQATASEAVFKHLLESYPQDVRIYQTLRSIYRQQVNTTALIDLIRREIKAFPARKIALYEELAQVYELQKNWKAAEGIYDTLLMVGGRDSLSVLEAQANLWVQVGNLEQALEAYKQLTSRDSDHVSFWLRRGMLAERMEQWEEALYVYDRLRELQPNDAFAYWKLGQANERLSRLEAAEALYREAVERGAQDPWPYYRLAMLLQGKDRKEASEWAEQAFVKGLAQMEDIQRQAQEVFDQRALSLEVMAEAREFMDVRERLERLQTISQESFHLLTTSAPSVYVEAKLQEWLEQYGGSGLFYYMVGRYYQEVRRDTVRAGALFKQAAEWSPQVAEIQEALGEYYWTRKQWTLAALAFERAISLQPDNHRYYSRTIAAYRKAGKLDMLCDKWQVQYRQQPQNLYLREHLIEALHKAGRQEEARRLIRTTQQ